jgi:lysozyme
VELSDRLLDQLKADEGFSAKPYKDTEGKLTVGYGYNLDAGMTYEEAELLLRHRAQRAADELARAWPPLAGLDAARRDAVLNMAYNLGVSKLLAFKRTLHALEEGRWADAAAAALDSKWARQVGARARRVAAALRGEA